MKKFLFNLLLVFCFLGSAVYAENIITNDYSNPDNWISGPAVSDSQVDVFYLYPTSCQVDDLTKTKICGVDHKVMRTQARKVFNRQATAFTPIGNIYAPFYSQIDARILANTDYETTKVALTSNKQGLADIYNALDYYFENINKGKPFILASHSQGSVMMLKVLSAYMKKHPEYYKNMVAAYVIGFPITNEYLKENPHLKFAKKHNDTGVIISYNTQAPDKSGVNIVWSDDQLVINPLSWKRNGKYVSNEKNLGSYDESTGKVTTPGIADAQIDTKQKVVVCASVDEEKYAAPIPQLFGHGSYHGQDYQFYYMNLRQNAKDRVEKYFSKVK